MKLLRALTAFILIFSLFAGTVAVFTVSAETTGDLQSSHSRRTSDPEPGKADLADTAAKSYTPRLTAPAYNNKYYYSNLNPFYKYGWGMPNCTAYAWGRAYEILGKEPDLSVYSAYLWYGYNKDNNIYSYGTTPKLGAIACWVYTSGDSGHVAVVEKIENNTITFSNSAYSTGVEFYTSTAPVKDPSNGNKTWIFQGYIYIGDFVSNGSQSVIDTPSGDVYKITASDGVNLRKGFGTDYQVVGGILCGQEVAVTKYQKSQGYTWGYTTYRGVSGWFVTDFAQQVNSSDESTSTPSTTPDKSPSTPENPTSNIPILSGPTTSAPTTSVITGEIPILEPVSLPDDDPEDLHMIMMGDLDEDEKITILDATRIQLILAELMKPTEYMLLVGDFDGDGNFTIMDSACIRYYIAYELV